MFRPTPALYLLARNGANLVMIIPAQFPSGSDEVRGEEGNPREPQVVSVHKHILDKDIGVAAVVEIATDVADALGIHDVDILPPSKQSSGRNKLVWLGFVLWASNASCGGEPSSLGSLAPVRGVCVIVSSAIKLHEASGEHDLLLVRPLGHEVTIITTLLLLRGVVVTGGVGLGCLLGHGSRTVIILIIETLITVLTLITILPPLNHLNHVKLSKVLVTKVLSLFVGFLRGVQIANINGDECSLRDVVKSPDAPTSLLCLEYLKLDSERILNNTIETSLGAFTVLVALVDASDHNLVKSSGLITHVLVYLVVSVTAGGLDGQLPARTLVFPPTVVRAVAGCHELGVSVEVDILLRQPHRAVLHILGVVAVNGVDAGDGHVLLAVAQVLDGAVLPGSLELVVGVQPPVKVEEVNLQWRLGDAAQNIL